MLVVASDRISVFDVVLADLIPDKGRVLTALSTFWFDADRATSCPTTWCRPTPPTSPRPRAPTSRAGRCSCARRSRCGSSASPAATCSARRGPTTRRPARSGPRAARRAARRPSGCRSRSSRPPPRPRRATTCRSPTPTPPRSWATSASSSCATSRCASTRSAPSTRPTHGLILADTKLEFGDVDGELLVIDEMLTPDSSRYWPRRRLPGRDVAAVVRQAVRARPLPLDRLGPCSRPRRACRRA